ncbi:MAG: protoporphyrinogen oxidase HemJ [Alphaproteobacteria bacterium]|nr:protoporphyrinogen oxidase HemJ [Alphaproteobacteria bacterium]
MFEFLGNYYLWIKSLHLIAVIAWMAGMMYLPRLFVYHTDAPVGSVQSEKFKLMEGRLLRGIINPAMILVFILGGLLLLTPGLIDWQDWWIWLKLGLVFALAGVHGVFSRWRREFAADKRTRSGLYYRIINEIPFVLMIFIVILVIVRPFGKI